MTDFTFVTARLATGAAISSPADVQQLRDAGITAIIDCRAEQDDTPFLTGSGAAYVWDPTADDGTAKGPAWFATGLTFALPLLVVPHQKVYAHCAGGVNRGPSMAMCIMMALGWTAEAAEAQIRLARPQVQLRYKADAIAAIAALGYQ